MPPGGRATKPSPDAGTDVGEPGRVLGGIAVALARSLGVRLPDLALLSAWGSPLATEVPVGAGPELLGTTHESLLAAGERRRRGAFYTSSAAAERVSRWTLDACAVEQPVVCDPASGGGAFLLAAARVLAERGEDPVDIVGRLVAIDLDPLAVAVTEATLCLWAGGRATPVATVADALLDPWPAEPDVVVANPPFLGQLTTGTARDRQRAAALEDAWGPAARGYVDDAALFLLAASRRVPEGGAVGMLQPESVLAVAGAASVRDEVGPLVEAIWLPGNGLFDAAVRVCALVLRRGRPVDEPAAVFVDAEARPVDRQSVAGSAWAGVMSGARGVPAVDIGREGMPTLGEQCRVTAGFRDEYYGLGPFVAERPDGDDGGWAPLVTSGLVDPAWCRWGETSARYGGNPWSRPAVDLVGVAGSPLGPWITAQRVPKVLVATQTRVLEAVADEQGAWLPCTPVLSVMPEDVSLWHVLAVLLAPPVSAWALREAGGAARSGDAVKLSVGQVRRIPLPTVQPSWDAAAVAVQEASSAADPTDRHAALLRAGEASCRAYEVTSGLVLDWWSSRLPYRGARV